jgi:hypothetical protein
LEITAKFVLFTKEYVDKMEEMEIGEACGSHRRQCFVEKSAGKSSLGRPRLGWEDFKLYFKLDGRSYFECTPRLFTSTCRSYT